MRFCSVVGVWGSCIVCIQTDVKLEFTADFLVVAEDIHGYAVNAYSAVRFAQDFDRRRACVRLDCQDASDARIQELNMSEHCITWCTRTIIGASRTLNPQLLRLESVVFAIRGDIGVTDLAVLTCELDVLCLTVWDAA